MAVKITKPMLARATLLLYEMTYFIALATVNQIEQASRMDSTDNGTDGDTRFRDYSSCLLLWLASLISLPSD